MPSPPPLQKNNKKKTRGKKVEQRAICPLRFVQGTSKVSQIPPPHPPQLPSPSNSGHTGTWRGEGVAPVTHRRAWTAQSLIRTAPYIRGGSGHAQCLGILLWKPWASLYAYCTALAVSTLCISTVGRERGDRLFRFTTRQGHWAIVVKREKKRRKQSSLQCFLSHTGQKHL